MDREKRDEGGSKQAGTKDLIDINLGNGDVWWSTRLYLIVALAEDYFGIKHINFLEESDGQENCFIGLATPRAILRDLTVADPRLEIAYRTAYDSVTNEKRDTAVFVKSDRNNILIEEVTPFVGRHRARNPSLGSVTGQHFAHAPIGVFLLAR